MALNVYTYDEFTETYVEASAGDMSNPIKTVHDPLEQSTVIKKLFLRNDNSSKYYTDVSLQFAPTATTQNNPTGWSYKIISGDTKPAEEDWAYDVTSGESIEMDDVGADGDPNLDFYPFWIRIDVPKGTSGGVYNSVYLSINYTEGNI